MSPDSKLIAPDGSDSSGLSDADLRSHLASQQLVIQDLAAQVANLSSRLPSLMVVPPSSIAGGSSGGHMPVRHKPAPVEFGRFNGAQPDAWIFQADRYFDFYGIIAEHKLTLASFYLDGEALEWYRWLYRNNQLSDWPRFTEKLLSRFCPRHVLSPEGRLSKMVQTSTVADFRRRFEAVLNETMTLPEEFLVECFLSGLRPDILTAVTAHEPTRLDQLINLAHIQEQRIIAEKGPPRPAFARTQPLLPTPTSQSAPIAPTTPSNGRLPFKRLSQAEMQSRREKGLCFNCDEKFSPGHRCKKLFLIEGCWETFSY